MQAVERISYAGEEQRRSLRVPFAARLFVLSLDPSLIFAGHCETTAVNSHGCEIHASRGFEQGTRLCLGNLPGSHVAIAHVVHSSSAGLERKVYSYERGTTQRFRIGLELDTPGNIWGLEAPPSDWR
jgi:hypothetical protein